MLTPTHMLVALALAYIFKLPKLPAFLAALALDLDIVLNLTGLGFPFVHRGIIHTPLFLIALTAVWYYYGRRSKSAEAANTGLSVGIGGLSHVALDFVTIPGVPLLFPLFSFIAVSMVDYANIVANAGIIILSLVFVLLFQYKPILFKEKTKKSRQRMLAAFLVFAVLIIIILWIGSFFDMYTWNPIAAYTNFYKL